MEQTIIRKTCDLCGRDILKVSPYMGWTGSGHICFAVTAGRDGGGGTVRYDAEDLCLECA